jgi:hypothetical protein
MLELQIIKKYENPKYIQVISMHPAHGTFAEPFIPVLGGYQNRNATWQ